MKYILLLFLISCAYNKNGLMICHKDYESWVIQCVEDENYSEYGISKCNQEGVEKFCKVVK